MAQDLLQKATSDHKDLLGAYVSGALATIVIRYVASVGHPSIVHVVLAYMEFYTQSRCVDVAYVAVRENL